MLVSDRVYGAFGINDAVLLDLISSKPIQRLKNIAQFGIPDEYYVFRNFSRFEHSVGVMLLVRKLGGSLEEQSAALLHDVSHTAFSHVVDWLFGSGEKEDYQDRIHEKIFMGSELPEILKRYNLDCERIADHGNFPLLEQPTPRLCADRIDYALREFRDWAAPGIVKECVNSFVIRNNRIVFSSKETAKKFAESFLKCQMVHWGGAQATMRYTLLSSALRAAISHGVISENDLLNDDNFVLGKLKDSSDPEIKKYLSLLAGKNLKIIEGGENPQYLMKKKFRHVDPEYVEDGDVVVLSETDSGFRALLGRNREINQKGLRLSISDA